ncbi:hypothetical protein BJ742DRAFT_811000 [Cladochytrium replicatum]|nr:hypothetical protein BJ742DRAFT_811000 [Cladochytrium replicatum]
MEDSISKLKPLDRRIWLSKQIAHQSSALHSALQERVVLSARCKRIAKELREMESAREHNIKQRKAILAENESLKESIHILHENMRSNDTLLRELERACMEIQAKQQVDARSVGTVVAKVNTKKNNSLSKNKESVLPDETQVTIRPTISDLPDANSSERLALNPMKSRQNNTLGTAKSSVFDNPKNRLPPKRIQKERKSNNDSGENGHNTIAPTKPGQVMIRWTDFIKTQFKGLWSNLIQLQRDAIYMDIGIWLEAELGSDGAARCMCTYERKPKAAPTPKGGKKHRNSHPPPIIPDDPLEPTTIEDLAVPEHLQEPLKEHLMGKLTGGDFKIEKLKSERKVERDQPCQDYGGSKKRARVSGEEADHLSNMGSKETAWR